MAHENVTKLLCMLQALAIQLAESVSVPHHGHDQFHDSFFTINHFLMSIISKVNMHHLYKSDIILISFLRK
jgi:hypothetical protein